MTLFETSFGFAPVSAWTLCRTCRTIVGSESTKWFTSCTNAGTSSATVPPSTATIANSVSSTPIARGTRRRWSLVAPADSTSARMIVISTSSSSVSSALSTNPAATSSAASSTAR